MAIAWNAGHATGAGSAFDATAGPTVVVIFPADTDQVFCVCLDMGVCGVLWETPEQAVLDEGVCVTV